MDEEEIFIRSFINIPVQETYVEGLLKFTEDSITNFLENFGYTNVDVSTSKEVNEDEKTVALTIYVDPGQRTMLNRISFEGNDRTHDVVLRREMRQMEKSWVSNNLLETSKLRLDRLGFFKKAVALYRPGLGCTLAVGKSLKQLKEHMNSMTFRNKI